MEIRLIKIVLITFILTSCSTNNLYKFDYINNDNTWINAYKDNAFYNCFMEGHQNDTILRNLIRKRDLQNPYEAIDVEDLIHAAELGRNIAKNIPIAKLGCEE